MTTDLKLPFDAIHLGEEYGSAIVAFAEKYGNDNMFVAHEMMIDEYDFSARSLRALWHYLGFKGDMPEILPPEFREKHLEAMRVFEENNQQAVRTFMSAKT